MRKRVTIIAIVIGAMLATGWIVAVRSGKRKPQQQAMLTFLSYTNFGVPDRPRRVRYDRFAAFRLTNASSLCVIYSADSIDVWTELGWQTNRQRGTPMNWPHFGGGLKLGESGVFYVPPPTNSRWRVRLAFREHATGWRGYQDSFNDYCANCANRIAGNTTITESFSGRRYELSSPEVTQ